MKTLLIIMTSLALLSSLKKDKRKKALLYYFDVTAANMPSHGTLLEDWQVTIRANSIENPGDICSGYSYLCVVGFEASELTVGKMHIADGPRAFYSIVSCKY